MFNKTAALLLLLCAAGAVAGAAPVPLTVDADHSTAVNQADADSGQVTYSGHVVITRGGVAIHGDRAVVYTRRQRLEKAVVTGDPVRFSWHSANAAPVSGEAQEVSYIVAGNSIELHGKVTLHRGAEIFSASTMHYALDTKVLTAEGGKNQRVHAVIPPATTTGGAAESP
ncbi:MAG: lipopolysaccharide transport periplasmic protein LptA [Gammaproteobacteria bacterium]